MRDRGELLMTTNKPTTPSRWRDVRDAVGAGLIGAMVAVVLVLWVVEVLRP